MRWPPETFIGWKLQGLASRGLRVVVASPTKQRLEPGLLPGVEVMPVPHWDDRPAARRRAVARDGLALLLTHPGRLVRLIRGVARPLAVRKRTPARLARRLHPLLRLARETPDVVHFEWESAVMGHMPLLDVWDCPVVVSCHGAGVRRHPHSPRFRNSAETLPAVFGRADAVHCVADAVVEEAALYGLDRGKASVIRTAVDPAFFTPPAGGRDGRGHALRVAGVSRLIWSKGHEYALIAIRELIDLGVPVRYDLFGGEPRADTGEVSDLPRIRHAIEDLGLADHVHVRGNLDSAGVRDGLQQADVLLHASLSDGLPTVIAEAMACELAVVVTDVGGVRELVTDGVEGHVLRPRDPRGLALALKALWDDPASRLGMGRAGRERVKAEFSLEGLVDDFERLYRSLTQAGSPAPAARAPAAPAGPPRPAPAELPGHEQRPLRVLSVGELSWSRGYEHALQAVQRLAGAGVRCEYRVVGEGAWAGALHYAVYQLGLGRAVEFFAPGDLPLAEHIRWADVFVNAAVVAGAAPGLDDARAAGLAVVSTGGEESCVAVPRRDPRALGEALAALSRSRGEAVPQ